MFALMACPSLNLPETLTRAQAAEALSVNLKTVDRWIKAGRLKAINLGPRMVRITMASLENLTKGTQDK